MAAQKRTVIGNEPSDSSDHLLCGLILLEVADTHNRLRSAVLAARMRSNVPVLPLQNRPVRMNHETVGHAAEPADPDTSDLTRVLDRIRRSFSHRVMQPQAARLAHSRT
jgi:hypothetical protein